MSACYKVKIYSVTLGQQYDTDFEGEGTTIQAALNRAKKSMQKEFPDGAFSYTYDTYQYNNYKDEFEYLQTKSC